MSPCKTPEKRKPALAVVGVGGSAGGLQAFLAMLSALPATTGFAFVFVSHLPPGPSQLQEVVSRETQMPVVTITSGIEPEANHVYVMGPDCTVSIEAGRFKVGPVLRPPHREIDTFFSSLAATYGIRSIAVLLSGMDEDGVRGLSSIKLAGGITIVQDGSAQSPRMPQAAIDAGCVDSVLSPADIARQLVQLSHHPWLESASNYDDPSEDLAVVLEVLRRQCGMDFSGFKASTLYRCLLPRMALNGYYSLSQYAAALADNEFEARAAAQSILIGFTDFFRDNAAFEELAQKALPRIFEGRPREQRRVWVVGTSTGQEAYSIAMLLEEYGSSLDFKIHATDLNKAALDRARAGVFSESAVSKLSPERLRRFFTREGSEYHINRSIRDRVTFSLHNVLGDALFSHNDFICCRNVMIFMEHKVKHQLLARLYRALRPQGILFLGVSESADRDMFAPLSERHRIYVKRPNAQPDWTPEVLPLRASASTMAPTIRDVDLSAEQRLARIERIADRLVLQQYAPPGVLVDARYEIVQYRGETGEYLTHYTGRPSTNLLKMTREGMLIDLRNCLQRAKHSTSSLVTPVMRIPTRSGMREIVTRVIPFKDEADRYYCIMFEDASPTAPGSRASASSQRPVRGRARKLLQDELTQRVEAQSAEIDVLRDEMQRSDERHVAVEEQLRATVEELRSINEEMQSTNEELNAVTTNLQMPMVMVWSDLRLRHVTPTAMRLLQASESDINRPLSEFRSPLPEINLVELLATSIRDGQGPDPFHALDIEQRWRLACIHPTVNFENAIDGAMVVLIDIHSYKTNQQAS